MPATPKNVNQGGLRDVERESAIPEVKNPKALLRLPSLAQGSRSTHEVSFLNHFSKSIFISPVFSRV